MKLMIKYIRTCLKLQDKSFRPKAHQVYESNTIMQLQLIQLEL